MCWLDDNPDILSWSSESISIPYRDKANGRIRRYYPDFWYLTTKAKQYLIEIKPAVQCKPPTKRIKRNKKGYLDEVKIYATNVSKWSAADRYATTRGMIFLLITEKDLANL